MKCIVLCPLALVLSLKANAQHQVSLSIQSGIGKMKPLMTEDYDLESTQLAVEERFAASFSVTTNYSYQFGRASFETGLSYRYLEGNQKEQFSKRDIQEAWGQTYVVNNNFDVYIDRKAHYLSLPLSLRFRLDDRVSVGGGLYGSYRLTNSRLINIYEDETTLVGVLGSGNTLSKFDYGLTGQVSFDLSSKLSILFTANYGLKNVANGNEKGGVYYTFQEEEKNEKLRNRQFVIGLKYNLFQHTKLHE